MNVKTMTAGIVLERHGADVIDHADPPKSLTNSQCTKALSDSSHISEYL